MDKREQLRSMLNHLINDKPEEATLDLHSYLSTKMQEVMGLAATPRDASDTLGTPKDNVTDPE